MTEGIIYKLIAVKRMIVSQAAKEVLTNIIKELKDDKGDYRQKAVSKHSKRL